MTHKIKTNLNKTQTKLITVSMSDVVRHPWYEKYKDSPKGLEALLYSMGMDITLPIESDTCEHRSTMTNLVVNCERFSGSERKDEQWEITKRLIEQA